MSAECLRSERINVQNDVLYSQNFRAPAHMMIGRGHAIWAEQQHTRGEHATSKLALLREVYTIRRARGGDGAIDDDADDNGWCTHSTTQHTIGSYCPNYEDVRTARAIPRDITRGLRARWVLLPFLIFIISTLKYK